MMGLRHGRTHKLRRYTDTEGHTHGQTHTDGIYACMKEHTYVRTYTRRGHTDKHMETNTWWGTKGGVYTQSGVYTVETYTR